MRGVSRFLPETRKYDLRTGLERWYVCGSIALGFFIPLVPTILGHFSHDPILNTW